jgi:hypothetical protein
VSVTATATPTAATQTPTPTAATTVMAVPKSLSPIQVLPRHDLIRKNFDKFQGNEWLPSGANFDHVLYESVKSARHECPLAFIRD